jgi:hypothetical protein
MGSNNHANRRDRTARELHYAVSNSLESLSHDRVDARQGDDDSHSDTLCSQNRVEKSVCLSHRHIHVFRVVSRDGAVDIGTRFAQYSWVGTGSVGVLVAEQTHAERIHELHNTLTWLKGEIYKITGATRWKGYNLCLLRERHVCIVAE